MIRGEIGGMIGKIMTEEVKDQKLVKLISSRNRQITSQTDLMSLGIGDEIEHEFYKITRDSRVQTSRSLLEIWF